MDAVSRRTLLGAAAWPLVVASAVRVARDAQPVRDVVAELRLAYSALDVESMLALVAADVRFVDPTFHLVADGREALRPILERGRASIESIELTLSNEIVAPPWVVVQQTQAGLFRTAADAAPRRFSVQGASLFRIEDGLVREWWDYYDVETFRWQVRGEG